MRRYSRYRIIQTSNDRFIGQVKGWFFWKTLRRVNFLDGEAGPVHEASSFEEMKGLILEFLKSKQSSKGEVVRDAINPY